MRTKIKVLPKVHSRAGSLISRMDCDVPVIAPLCLTLGGMAEKQKRVSKAAGSVTSNTGVCSRGVVTGFYTCTIE